ncbi:MAG: AraC family transcriptional regulator [Atopostipes suicloacalis]|nr:AraC family transcriptional regulator [Atopostipes suicloacalis]MDN6730843.1 AraC family transcriptional regulator [Atopostipes suicloacalis]
MAYEIHKNKKEIERLPARLLYVTHSSYDQGWHSSPHSHDFIELFYVVSGQGSFIVNNKKYSVKKNDLIIINPKINHTERSSDNHSMEYITLGFDGVSFNKKENNHKESIIIYKADQIKISFLIRFLLEELKENKLDIFHISQNILELILIKLNYSQNIQTQATENKEINSAIYEIKKYIDLNYSDSISLDVLAEVSHLNKYYLSHSFKEETGISPIQYLNETRIKNAKILLESTNYSISEISRFTGFSSQSFFSQRFKEISSFSPSHYREKKQKN